MAIHVHTMDRQKYVGYNEQPTWIARWFIARLPSDFFVTRMQTDCRQDNRPFFEYYGTTTGGELGLLGCIFFLPATQLSARIRDPYANQVGSADAHPDVIARLNECEDAIDGV